MFRTLPSSMSLKKLMCSLGAKASWLTCGTLNGVYPEGRTEESKENAVSGSHVAALQQRSRNDVQPLTA